MWLVIEKQFGTKRTSSAENAEKEKVTKMSKKTVTKSKLGNGLRRETVRYGDGSGHSTVYKPGLIFRDVKSNTSWGKKGK